MRKILAQGVGTISTPGKLNSEKSCFCHVPANKNSPWLICAPQGCVFRQTVPSRLPFNQKRRATPFGAGWPNSQPVISILDPFREENIL